MAAIGLSTLIPMLVRDDIPLTLITQSLYTGVDQFPLIAVTGFLLAGELMERSGITDKVMEIANKSVGNFTGGLAAVTILACMFFAALSGSGPATTAAVGSLAIPAMINRGYTKRFSGGVVATGGVLGILIPPSNPMIIYAVIANVSVTQMFMAGFIPGIFVGLVLIFTAYIISKRKGFIGSGEKFSPREFGKALWKGKWAILAPLIILGGIYGGIFTPTEAAEVAVIYSLVVGLFIHRTLKWKMIYESLVRAAFMSGTIIVIVGIAVAFGRLLAMYQIPQNVAMFLTGVSSNPYIVMLMIIGFLIFVGTWMETLAQIIILTPIFLPVVTQLGIDPITFGIIFVICCEIGFLTPPLGANLYVVTKLADISLEEVSVAVLPFVLALILCVVTILFFPDIALFLPKLLSK
ncbi:MAG: C4-dicarboxylate ABC transporter permease [Clostridiaceae bacterium BRH_c20a]|nr:MAG: C4-dicarboxylate ABC transporter permease [Clostridiaceae bacterium BRH_c20a]